MGGSAVGKKVLVVEDDANISEVLKLYLAFEGFEVLLTGDGDSALAIFQRDKPDIIILDLMLHGKSGLEVCQALRKESNVPVLMLTAKDAMEDKLIGFRVGADDYVVKPFDPLEVVARVRALLRRTAESQGQELTTDKTGALEVSMERYEVRLDGQAVELKPRELQLLFFFWQNQNKVFDREQLLEKVWGYDYAGETRTVDVHIQRLREKLEYEGCGYRFKTVRGVGYKFEAKL
ncbi:MAG: response regulator transcription factor [Dethiobacter sp.]|jgi:DNA-binding response OmpR family regulator|nr:response regulator transcription factor [Dethiobacter sp.]MBS3901199.1 response regulator transcription factor [Dethiobacter sp.]MBS3989109.1 response regulator transcription factor [Dethiobacter sp.]